MPPPHATAAQPRAACLGVAALSPGKPTVPTPPCPSRPANAPATALKPSAANMRAWLGRRAPWNSDAHGVSSASGAVCHRPRRSTRSTPRRLEGSGGRREAGVRRAQASTRTAGGPRCRGAHLQERTMASAVGNTHASTATAPPAHPLSQGKPCSAHTTSTAPPKDSDGASSAGAKPSPPLDTSALAQMGVTWQEVGGGGGTAGGRVALGAGRFGGAGATYCQGSVQQLCRWGVPRPEG